MLGYKKTIGQSKAGVWEFKKISGNQKYTKKTIKEWNKKEGSRFKD